MRLPLWKKDNQGKPILNVRISVGTGGSFSFEKRQRERLNGRHATSRERDTARKARENKKKKQKIDRR